MIWRWTSFWYPIRNVVSFKREVYRRALKELMPFVFNGLKQQVKTEQKTTQKQNPNRSARRNKTRRKKRPTN